MAFLSLSEAVFVVVSMLASQAVLCPVADPLSVLWVLCQPFIAGELAFEKEECLGSVLFWSAIKITSTIQHLFHMVSSVGEVRPEEECQRWEEMLSEEAVDFEVDAVVLAVTGLCRCKGNAEQGWDKVIILR